MRKAHLGREEEAEFAYFTAVLNYPLTEYLRRSEAHDKVVCAGGKHGVRLRITKSKRMLLTNTRADLKESQCHLEYWRSCIDLSTPARNAHDKTRHPDITMRHWCFSVSWGSLAKTNSAWLTLPNSRGIEANTNEIVRFYGRRTKNLPLRYERRQVLGKVYYWHHSIIRKELMAYDG